MARTHLVDSPPARRRYLPWIVVLVLLVAGGIVAWQAYVAERGSGLLHALDELLAGLPPDEQRIGRVIRESYVE
jgi:hypothetical protein